MKIGDGQVEDVALIIARRVYGQDAADDQDRAIARRILLDVAPVIARVERQRIAALVSPLKLDALATWLDVKDDQAVIAVPQADREVQRDLRLLAQALRGREPAPEAVPA